ncbi:MAG TPA: zinc-dependent metalloprotease [Solirubrobacteraceae bacterium]
MIDWKAAERIAGMMSGGAQASASLPGDIAAITADSADRVAAYTQMVPARPIPPPEIVSRAEWITANLQTMKPILDPLSGKIGETMGPLGAPIRLAGGLVLAAQVGALTGYLSQRVLGQYDLGLLDPTVTPRLLFVGPNLNLAAGKLDADREELVRWVAFHEVTHAVQFGSVGWLREHLAGLLQELLAGLTVKVDTKGLFELPGRAGVRDLVDAIRKGDLVSLVVGADRKATVDRLQATMAVVEGHAEHVMDAVGAEVLPSQAALRDALERRRETRSPVLRLFERLLGLELKMRQYRDGKRFCDRVVELGGLPALNRVWSRPDALPTLAELADPAGWVRRTAAAG